MSRKSRRRKKLRLLQEQTTSINNNTNNVDESGDNNSDNDEITRGVVLGHSDDNNNTDVIDRTEHKISFLALCRMLISSYDYIIEPVQFIRRKDLGVFVIEIGIGNNGNIGSCLYDLKKKIAYNIDIELWSSIKYIKDLLADEDSIFAYTDNPLKHKKNLFKEYYDLEDDDLDSIVAIENRIDFLEYHRQLS